MPAIRSDSSTSNRSKRHSTQVDEHQNRLFCTRCRLVKDLDQFDQNQLSNRFGKTPIMKNYKFKNYNVEEERLKSLNELLDSKHKIWCKRCVPKRIEEANCSDCLRSLPRTSFSQAQLKSNKTDEDRLCKDCSNLITERIEAHRLGNHFEVEMIDQKLDSISHQTSQPTNQSISNPIVRLEDYDDEDDDEDE
ncbi:hypothetical protein DFH28DRAFT_920966 [Melampsora americana]|nr:hypothetical protein DFH28DRAFT_920966 [Melampsora americana]